MLKKASRARQRPARAPESDFATRLRALGVKAQRKDLWLMVGTPKQVAGWKLHVSATVSGVDRLFQRVLPYLVRRGAHFKIASGLDVIVLLGAGNFGEAQIGKVVTVYTHDDVDAVALAHDLIEHTRGIPGPPIATDLHLGAAVYARYGAVRPRITYDRFGQASELIPDGHGNWVPDLRPVPFGCPPGIVNPFAAAASDKALPPTEQRVLLGGRYFVTDVLRPGVAGSVFRAIDLHRAKGPVACVLKQARAHCSADELGRDRRVRLRHEARMLARLFGLSGIARAGRYFEVDTVGYLPIAYIPGMSLGELVHQVVVGRSWRSVRATARRRLVGYAVQLVRRLSAAHGRGVIHRDVAPGNVWIGDDDRVYLLDWECAHAMGSRAPTFQFGTPGFSDISLERRAPTCRDDWQACARVIAFMLSGMDPLALMHGELLVLETRLMELTGLPDSKLLELLAHSLTDANSQKLSAATLLAALASVAKTHAARRTDSARPLFMTSRHESVLSQGLEHLTAKLRLRLERQSTPRLGFSATTVDAHGGIAGLLYVLAAAHSARVLHLDSLMAQQAVIVLTTRAPVTPDLPGLVHGSAGRALAVAAAMQCGCISADHALHAQLAVALAGRLDWPDFTHGAAGQGFAALACARRLKTPQLAKSAAACAEFLVHTQGPEGAWTLPEGSKASGERYTGFAHGAAGVMGFLGSYAAHTGDSAADAAWRRAEAWLVRRARHGRGGKCQWPQSDSNPALANRWCHGAPGIALGWLCVARAHGIGAIAEECMRGALHAIPLDVRSDCLGQCHGLAGIGEVHLEAHMILREEKWRERAADIAKVLVAMFRKRASRPWHYLAEEPLADADGLMLGTAGILHFLLRYHYPASVTCAPLLA